MSARSSMGAVPGTFRNRPPLPQRDRSANGMAAEDLLLRVGALTAERWIVGECTVMVARENLGGWRWHLSIAHPSRYPTWDEIKTAVYGCPTVDGVAMAQVLGPVGSPHERVDLHRNCFHLYEIFDPQFM